MDNKDMLNTADGRQRYLEQLCEMDEKSFRELWEKSEVAAKLEKMRSKLQNENKERERV